MLGCYDRRKPLKEIYQNRTLITEMRGTHQLLIALQKFYRNEYVTMKQQWQSITPQQEKNFSLLRERKHLVGRLETGGE